MFDVKKAVHKAEEGSVLKLKDEHGNPAMAENGQQAWIKLAGMNSKRWREATDTVGDRRLKRAQRSGSTTAKDMREQRSDQCYVFGHVTLEWGGIGSDGQVLECTEENAQALYLECPYLFAQVDEFLSDQANF